MRSKRRRFKVVECLGQEFAVYTDSRFWSHAAQKFRTEGAGRPQLIQGFRSEREAKEFVETWRRKGERKALSTYNLFLSDGRALERAGLQTSAPGKDGLNLSLDFKESQA
jgi:hypothetical protein